MRALQQRAVVGDFGFWQVIRTLACSVQRGMGVISEMCEPAIANQTVISPLAGIST
ncbi:MAG: hypothetical protein U0694_16105 [Anaerolineae bacterium]